MENYYSWVIGVFLTTIFTSASSVGAAGSNSTIIGQCLFYGDKHVECRGRLRCKPSDFLPTGLPPSDNSGIPQQLPELEQVCPGVDEQSNGVWTESQGIVPVDYSRVPFPNEVVAKCYFRTNGTFYCIGGQIFPDAYWEGLFSGSLNAAFDLGLDKWWSKLRSTTPTPATTTTTTTTVTRTTTTTQPTTPLTTRGSFSAATKLVGIISDRGATRLIGITNEPLRAVIDQTKTRVFGGDDNDNDGSKNYNSRTQPVIYPTNGDRETDRNLQNNEVGDVDRSSAQKQRLLGAGVATADDDDNIMVTYTVAPRRVVVCEYYNNGQVGCRNCTERLSRVELESGEYANSRNYNCTQPKNGPVLKRWTADNGIVPLTPDPTVPTRLVVATCIFERSSQSYECHGDSLLCPDNQGNRVHTNKCLTGKRWNGDYSGDFSYMF